VTVFLTLHCGSGALERRVARNLLSNS